MELQQEQIDSLVQNPAESLSVEVKNWLDLNTPEGQVNLVRSVFALRNHNGGFLVIGFQNANMLPDANRPKDIRTDYHVDVVQRLILKHSSQSFAVEVKIGNRDGMEFPVVVVPSGVRTPVAVKSPLSSGSKILDLHDVYVRTVVSNHTPSSSKASYRDWEDLVQKCFENREADIGQFLRRHLSGLNPEVLQDLAASLTQTFAPTPTDEALARTFMEEGEARYLAFCQRRQLTLPSHGQWEVALVISGTASEIKPHNFLELIATLNPRLSGWPVWFDPRNMDRTQLPELNEGIWEALIVDFNNGVLGEYLDFMRLDPHGRFFLLRALDDDIYSRRGGPTPMKEFDAMIPIYKATEAIAVGQAFAKGMGYPLEGTTLSFMFKWTGLRGRTLTSWASQSFMLRSHRKSSQEEVESFVQVPLDAPISTVGNRVYQLLSPLYEAFEGFEQPEKFVADRVEKIINRKI